MCVAISQIINTLLHRGRWRKVWCCFQEPKDFLEILEDSPMVVVSWIAFLVKKIRGNEEAERILCFHCGDYSTQTKYQRLRSTFLLWFQSSLQWKFLVFMQPHVNVCFRNHAAPVLASGFPFLALKSQLFSSENSNVLLIILAKVGFCVKYILHYNPWNQPVFI